MGPYNNQVQYQYEAFYSKVSEKFVCALVTCAYVTDFIQEKFQLVLVTFEPEGFPAKQHVPERQFIIFNIGNFFAQNINN